MFQIYFPENILFNGTKLSDPLLSKLVKEFKYVWTFNFWFQTTDFSLTFLRNFGHFLNRVCQGLNILFYS